MHHNENVRNNHLFAKILDLFGNLTRCNAITRAINEESEKLEKVLQDYKFDDLAQRSSMISFDSENRRCRQEVTLILDSLYARSHLLSHQCHKHVVENIQNRDDITDHFTEFLEEVKTLETQFRCLYGNLIATHVKKLERNTAIDHSTDNSKSEPEIEDIPSYSPGDDTVFSHETSNISEAINQQDDNIMNVYTVIAPPKLSVKTSEDHKPMFGLPPLPSTLRSKLVKSNTIIQSSDTTASIPDTITPAAANNVESEMFVELNRVMKSRAPRKENLIIK
jgi:hypothetical protein